MSSGYWDNTGETEGDSEFTWAFTQAAVHRVDAGLSLQPGGRRLGQVATEPGVAGLPGQPLQGGVGEGGHVLPAPVGHVDFPQPHPGRHRGLVLGRSRGEESRRGWDWICEVTTTLTFDHHNPSI